MRFLLGLIVVLSAVPAHAAVYKCTNASGTVEFKDKPCPPGAGGEITVKGVARSDEAAAKPNEDAAEDGAGESKPKKPGNAGGGALTGTWCEFAVSMGVDGEKDESAPAQWNISGDSLDYRMKTGAVIKSRIIRNGDAFALENGMLGGPGRDWEIVSRSGDTVVLHGPIGGHFHLRKGACR